MRVLLFAVLFVVLDLAWSYPSGAPVGMCGRYIPQHPNMGTPVGPSGPRSGPYVIEAKPNGNRVFTVTLRATSARPFKGFLIQAIDATKGLPVGPSDVVGSFQPDFSNPQFGRLSQVRQCSPFAGTGFATHTSRDDKNMVQLQWRPSASLLNPDVKFVATVVQDKNHFYVVYSDPIQTTDSNQQDNTIGGRSIGSLGGGLPSNTPNTNSFGGSSLSSNTFGGSSTGTSFNDGFPNTLSGSSGSTSSSGPFSSNTLTGSDTVSFTFSDRSLSPNIDMTNPSQTGPFSLDSSSPRDPPPPIILPNGNIATNLPSTSSGGSSMVKTSVSFTSINSPVLASESIADNTDMVPLSSPESSSGGLAVSFNDPLPIQPVETMTGTVSFTNEIGSVVDAIAAENGPTIQIIEIPILPEGKTAALLNINSGAEPAMTAEEERGIQQRIRAAISNSSDSTSGQRTSSISVPQGPIQGFQGNGMGRSQMTGQQGGPRPNPGFSSGMGGMSSSGPQFFGPRGSLPRGPMSSGGVGTMRFGGSTSGMSGSTGGSTGSSSGGFFGQPTGMTGGFNGRTTFPMGTAGSMTGGMSGGMRGGMPGGMSGGMTGGMPGGMSGGMPGGMTGGMPGGMSGSMTGGMSGSMTGGRSSGMTGGIGSMTGGMGGMPGGMGSMTGGMGGMTGGMGGMTGGMGGMTGGMGSMTGGMGGMTGGMGGMTGGMTGGMPGGRFPGGMTTGGRFGGFPTGGSGFPGFGTGADIGSRGTGGFRSMSGFSQFSRPGATGGFGGASAGFPTGGRFGSFGGSGPFSGFPSGPGGFRPGTTGPRFGGAGMGGGAGMSTGGFPGSGMSVGGGSTGFSGSAMPGAGGFSGTGMSTGGMSGGFTGGAMPGGTGMSSSGFSGSSMPGSGMTGTGGMSFTGSSSFSPTSGGMTSSGGSTFGSGSSTSTGSDIFSFSTQTGGAMGPSSGSFPSFS